MVRTTHSSPRLSPGRRAVVRALALFSLVSCGITADPAYTERLEEITPDSCKQALESLVAIGPRYAGDHTATIETLGFLEHRLRSFGYRVEREFLDIRVGGVRQINLIAELEGKHPTEVIELGAHYDTVRRSPGADDNGSGVIGVLETARVLASHRPNRTIRFCLFAAEEVGLLGSQGHVRALEAERDAGSKEEHLGLLNLEMIGYRASSPDSQGAPIRIPLIADLPRVGDFVLVAGNLRSSSIGARFEDCVDAYVPELRYYSAKRIAGFFGDATRSDHAPYWGTGRKAVMLTDTANFRNPHYHRKSDTLEEIDFEFLSQVARATAATMLEWAE